MTLGPLFTEKSHNCHSKQRKFALLWSGPLALMLALTACNGRTITHDRPVKVLVPVSTPCSLPRPTPPAPLSARSDWDTLDVKQKAALVGKQALLWQTYGEQLNAATGACP
jgi:hypothetical protein